MMISTSRCRAEMRRLLRASVVVVLVLQSIFVSSARADVIGDIATLFAADSFPDTEQAIGKIAASNHAQAQAMLEALADRRLLIDAATKSLGIKQGSAVLDAATGKLRADFPADASAVRVNNRLRGVIEAALGSFALRAADPAKRIQAIDAIAKSRDLAALPRIDAALAKETDPRVKTAFERARATLVLADPAAPSSTQLAAIATLSANIDADTLAKLRAAAASDRPDVKQAATTALASLERRQIFTNAAQNVWYGLSLGSVLLLASAGLAITFGVMGVINMAHGEMVMIGAYTTFVVQELFKAILPGAVDFALLASLPIAFLVTGLVGVGIERGIIRFLYGRPLETLLATWGVSLILQQAIRASFGASNVQVSTPSYMNGSFEVLGLSITYGRMWIVIFTLLAFATLQIFIRRSALGLQMRAVTQNRRMASAMGIRTGRVDALTFGLGCGIAGVAGVALSQIDNVAPNLGQSYIVDCFMVVVFGGVGSLWGTLVSAFSLGIANKLLEPIAGAVLAKIAILVLLILFIQKRPRGLFALKGRAVEA
jgi:urea transport system permease protein